MKKILYTIAILLSTWTVTKAQTAVRETKDNLADFSLIGGDLLVYTIKENNGQFLYTEKRGDHASYHKEVQLNGGGVNALIGSNAAGDELYVYQKVNRKQERIAIYHWDGTSFQKTGEKPFPKFRNHSYNMGAHLSADQNTLIITAGLRKTKGYDDLYLSKWENGKWSKPANFDKPVNTRESEFAPFVVNDSLFFTQKSGDNGYVFSVPMSASKPNGLPTKVTSLINKENAFNAGYKRIGEKQMWITRTPDGVHTAYILEPAPIVVPPVVEPKPELVAAPTPQPEAPVAKEMAVNYDLNEVFMSSADAASLDAFLALQPTGATIWLKGYSDSIGPDKAKRSVARKRAEFLKKYVERYHKDRQFKIETSSDVLGTAGRDSRKVEIHKHD
jgi:outer membrane protein OmpA-like peptidoglycan-associated protein